MKDLIIKVHSSVDLITNSSTVIFMHTPNIQLVKTIFSTLLKLAGSDKSVDDLVSITPYYPRADHIGWCLEEHVSYNGGAKEYFDSYPEVIAALREVKSDLSINNLGKFIIDITDNKLNYKNKVVKKLIEKDLLKVVIGYTSYDRDVAEYIRIKVKSNLVSTLSEEEVSALNSLHELFELSSYYDG